MAIITISRGCFSHGKEIAEKVADRLNYECVSREILIEASQFFNVSIGGLKNSMEKEPSFLERITHGREKYLAYIKAALLEHARNGNLVYHGHAGHLLLQEIPSVFKVRIIADMKERIRFLRQKENLSEADALRRIRSEDSKRSTWTKYIYNRDIQDATLYDMVLSIGALSMEDACDIICRAAQSKTFDIPARNCDENLTDIAICTHVRAALAEICDARVTCKDGNVTIKVAAQKIRKDDFVTPHMQSEIQDQLHGDLIRQIAKIARSVPSVKDVVCDIEMPYYH